MTLAAAPVQASSRSVPVPAGNWQQVCLDGSGCTFQADLAALQSGRARFRVLASSPYDATLGEVVALTGAPTHGYLPARARAMGSVVFQTVDTVARLEDGSLTYTFEFLIDEVTVSTFNAYDFLPDSAELLFSIAIRGLDCGCYGQFGMTLDSYPSTPAMLRIAVPVLPDDAEHELAPGRFKIDVYMLGSAAVGDAFFPGAGTAQVDLDATLVSITQD